jgi:hypothetical protein
MREDKVIRPINELDLVLVESLAAIIKPIVMEAVQEIMGRDPISSIKRHLQQHPFSPLDRRRKPRVLVLQLFGC